MYQNFFVEKTKETNYFYSIKEFEMELFKTNQVSCRPVDTFQQLLNWSKETECQSSRPYRVRKLKLPEPPDVEHRQRPQMLVCHDMRNNYLDDRYFQGSNDSDDYTFYHWNLIDTFIYFSHHFVTIPPESWTNAAHENNVRMLGTFITEWTDGYKICEELLKDEAMIDRCVDKLVEMTLFYGFDGWLINIENPVEKPFNLVYFVRTLTDRLHSIDPSLYKVIWYDSVLETGELKWQNEVNKLNECFFKVCDGIFINYNWKDENLLQCTTYLDRIHDVYIGIDVFGRGCFGGGGFNTCLALDKINQYNLSCAIFAPGWVHECTKPVSEFIQNNEKYWGLLEGCTQRRELTQLPIITTFSHSRSKHFFVSGKSVKTGGWTNFNVQSLMPVLSSSNTNISWCFEDAFYAGSCLSFTGEQSQVRLFDLDINVGSDKSLLVQYAFKVDAMDLAAKELNNKFKLELRYRPVNTDSVKCFYFDSNFISNEEVGIEKCIERTNSSGWHLKSFHMTTKTSLKLLSLAGVLDETISDKKNLKLGYLKILEPNIGVQERTPIDIKMLKSVRAFSLKKEMYLGIHLDWSDLKSSHRYYNLFIDEGAFIKDKCEYHEVPSLQYIGTSASKEYRLCLKISENFSYNFKRTDCEATDLSNAWFSLYIQCVDSEHHDENLSDPSVIKCLVPLTNFSQRNEGHFSFIQEIIFDLEVF